MSTTTTLEHWLNYAGASRHTSIPITTLRGYVSRAEESGIPFARRGRQVRFKASELDAWLRGDQTIQEGAR